MARGNKSTFEGVLPIAKRYKVAAINWGLVAGKTQTYLPWDSWQRPYVDREPVIWFHEVFRTDGTPYRAAETALIKRVTGKVKAKAVKAQNPSRQRPTSPTAAPFRSRLRVTD
ncbi:MAG: hypothetical protein WKF30_06540 [Pyrinomonadaceae bacterium]